MNSTTTKIAGASFFALTAAGLTLAGATAANAVVDGMPQSDAFIGQQDTVLSVDAASGVLANDDCTGTATVGSIANFINGELDLHVDGSFDYTPAAGYAGPRTFDYELLCDGISVGFTTASIVFSPAVPIGASDYYTTPQDTTLTIAPNGVLANDTAALAVIDAKDLPAGLTPQLDGSFVYSPPAGFVGDVVWSYRMSNGSDTFSDWIPVTISVTAVAQAIPATDDGDTELPTLAYTGAGDVSTWLLGPAMALLGLGGAAAFVARRRAQLS